MSSKVEICNMGLALIGDAPIDSLSENNDRATVCNLFYDSTRDATLRAHPWGFAKQRKALALDAESPLFFWENQFTLPTEPYCLRVLGVDEDFPGQIPYSIEERNLLCDESAISILYIAQITDTGLFDSTFTDAFVARLAMSFALALTKKESMLSLAAKLYEIKIAEAQTVDGLEATKQTYYNTDLIVGR